MSSADTVQPCNTWSHDHSVQYGWNALTGLHPHLNRATAGLTAFASFVAIGAAHGPIRVIAAAWAAVLVVAVTLEMQSWAARFMRTPRVIYRLRDDQYRVLYVGRTRDWPGRFEAHTDTSEDFDEPWRWRITADNSAPFKWCLTPWGEWYGERFRIHQAATLAALRFAPAVKNDQHNRPYRSPMAVVAVLLWAAEELLFGSQPFKKVELEEVEEEDPQTDDSYEPDTHDDSVTAPPQPASRPSADVVDDGTVDDVFERMVSEEWPEWVPGCPEPSPGEQGYCPGPGCPESPASSLEEADVDPSRTEAQPETGTGPTATHSPTADPASEHGTNQATNDDEHTAGAVGERGAGDQGAGSLQPQSGAAGGRACTGNGFGEPCPDDAPAVKGPRCVACHRSYEKTRKDRLRKKTRDLFGESDAD